MPEVIPHTGMDKKQLMIAGGIGVAAILLIVFLRSRSSGEPASQFPSPEDQPMMGGGGGFAPPMQVQAPTQAVADWYTQALQEADVAAAKLQNDYLGEQLRQNRSQFDLQQRQAEEEHSIFAGVQRGYATLIGDQINVVDTLYKTGTYKKGNMKVECGKGESMYYDINGNVACKASGKSGVKAVGDQIGGGILSTVAGFFQGFSGAAQGAGQYYGAQVFGTPGFGTPGISGQTGRQARRPAPAQQRTVGRPSLPKYEQV